ncbi:MAG TPA: cupredoxin domain-containing protein [Solirubrobacterales bacterium]|nr:cupredoxin domain-containing protein [Solirubrobacterales bacterium]
MRSKRRFAALFVIVAAIAVPIAGCGGDDDDDDAGADTGAATQAATTGGASGGGETVDMSLTDFALNPADPTVKAGTVTFNVTNDGQAPHALEVEGPGEEVETETLSGGGSEKLTVDLSKPGTYEMYCPVGNHREMGMEGQVTVE